MELWTLFLSTNIELILYPPRYSHPIKSEALLYTLPVDTRQNCLPGKIFRYQLHVTPYSIT